jgi:plastocyanin
MTERIAALAIVVVTAAAAGGLFATPSNSAGNSPNCDPVFGCPVYLTGTGPSPTTLTIKASEHVHFYNGDSVPHTVVFANGLCSLTVPAGATSRVQGAVCSNRFDEYVGTYAYTVDGKFNGTVITTPLTRSVSLAARTHSIRGGTRLTLHGRVNPPGWRHHVSNPAGWRTNVSVIVLARHNSKHPYRPIATVNPGLMAKVPGNWKQHWTLTVQPGETTTYIAKVTAQAPQGQIWTNAKSRPFTVRIQH